MLKWQHVADYFNIRVISLWGLNFKIENNCFNKVLGLAMHLDSNICLVWRLSSVKRLFDLLLRSLIFHLKFFFWLAFPSLTFQTCSFSNFFLWLIFPLLSLTFQRCVCGMLFDCLHWDCFQKKDLTCKTKKERGKKKKRKKKHLPQFLRIG